VKFFVLRQIHASEANRDLRHHQSASKDTRKRPRTPDDPGCQRQQSGKTICHSLTGFFDRRAQKGVGEGQTHRAGMSAPTTGSGDPTVHDPSGSGLVGPSPGCSGSTDEATSSASATPNIGPTVSTSESRQVSQTGAHHGSELLSRGGNSDLANKSGRKKSSAEERQRIILALFPQPEQRAEFKKRCGMDFNPALCTDSRRFMDLWVAFKKATSPSSKKVSKLRDLARDIHKNKIGKQSAMEGKAKQGSSKRPRESQSTSTTPASAGKPLAKIPKVGQTAADRIGGSASNAERIMVVDDDEPNVIEGENEEPVLSSFVGADEGTYADAIRSGRRTKKDEPFLLFIHAGQEERKLMDKETWQLIQEKFQEVSIRLIMEDKAYPQTDWIGWSNGVGLIVLEDLQSLQLTQEIIGTITVAGDSFRAWAKGEKGKYEPLTIQIPSAFPASTFSARRLVQALVKQNGLPEINDNIVIRSCKGVPSRKGVRLLRIGASEEVIKTIGSRPDSIRLGTGKVTVYYQGKPLRAEQEEQAPASASTPM